MRNEGKSGDSLKSELERLRAELERLQVAHHQLRGECDKACAERDLMRGILDALPDVPVDGEVLFANAGLTTTTARRLEDVLGHALSETFPTDFENGLFEAYVEAMTLSDIDAAKRAEQALAEEQAMREQIIEHAPAAIAYFDHDMVFRVVNPTFYRMTTRRPETVLGRTYAQVFPEAPPGVEDALWRVLREGETFQATAFPFPLEVAGGGSRETYWDFIYLRVPGSGGQGRYGMLVICSDVTERVERERRAQEHIQALEDQKALMKGVLDSALDAVLVWKLVRDERGQAADATCLHANPAASSISRLAPEHIVGRRMRELFPDNFKNGLFEAYVQVAETGEPFDKELLYHGQPMGGRWVSVKAAKVNDGFVVTASDIHERKMTEQALVEERMLREIIIQHAAANLNFLDQNLVFRVVNPVWTAQTGIPADQALGRHVMEVLPQARDTVLPLLEQLLETGGSRHVSAEYFPLVENGRTRDVYWDVDFIAIPGPNGRPLGILTMGQDITHRVEREARDRETIAELEQADRLKDEFLGVVSHELRTPVHVVMGYLRILLKDTAEPLTARQRAMVEKAARKTDDLAKGKGLTMTCDFPSDLPLARFDVLRVGQVVTNLVGNAIKFTAAGGAIRLAAERRGERLRVEVADSGIGIDPSHQARIFDRFVQADMASTREAGGVGLGLAIAKQLVEAHGGTLGVESVPGHGSTFWFELPLAGPEQADA